VYIKKKYLKDSFCVQHETSHIYTYVFVYFLRKCHYLSPVIFSSWFILVSPCQTSLPCCWC
jgi:hypothetical protein